MDLIASIKVVLANTFVMYFKAHSYHWNVEGRNFAQDHEFFGGLYAELHAAIDPIAEEIRAIDSYAPFSLNELYTEKSISEDFGIPETPQHMYRNLLEANQLVTESLKVLFKTAESANNQGLADFAAGRLDVHAKHGWMLKSILKGFDE